MANKATNVFLTEESSLLLWLSEHQIEMSNGEIIKFSQEELSQELHCSPASINKRMKKLYESGCLTKCNKKGNYQITNIGTKIISEIKKIETMLSDNRKKGEPNHAENL